ncbi:HD domain-containing protein [Selenihalanaerobacter shriftii]|uniref:HD domain-containing protein n=1 Tax=Selenihalanaerobacter shriftii TaxID=142842 RepID=A0A1T4P719_9FIRM|nr:HD domain-containing protein [Selenihalanaerobacter shriftii]SJZ86708.1 HD domain-containing protein [Selenihalanaerobacter shriftii]
MKRLNKLINSPKYNQYLKKNSQSEEDRIFCKHNWEHLINVGRITYVMVLERNVGEELFKKLQLEAKVELKEVIYTAAFLHDIGRWKEYKTGEDHAQISAELAVDLLERHGFTTLEQKAILRAIKEHRGEVNSKKSILGRLICEADNLSRNCKSCSARQSCKGIKNPKIKY